jgi:chemotaxis protein CheX
MTEDSAVKPQSFTLPREMDLLAAESLKTTLIGLLQQGGDCLLDGSRVERLSTPCIEVLVAAENAFSETQHSFHVSDPSPGLRDALESLGLADRIEKWRASS